MFVNIKRVIIFVTTLTILGIDQISKNTVLCFFENNNICYHKITHFLNFVKLWNKGISFGIFCEYHLPPVLFVLIYFVTVVIILCCFINTHPLLLGIIIGGATGNIIDRIIFGKVFDFIDLHVLDYHLPIFNIADIFIIVGTIFLLIYSIEGEVEKISYSCNKNLLT